MADENNVIELDEIRAIMTGSGVGIPEIDGPIAAGDINAKRDEMNKTWAVIEDYYGKTIFMQEVMRNGRLDRKFFGQTDFKILTSNITALDGRRTISVAEEWMKWPQRRNYLGTVFAPGRPAVVDGCINEWTGFAVEAKQGCWKLILRHIYTIMCNGDRKKFLYVMKWFANAVQNPDRPAMTVLMFKGRQGAGKSIMLNALHDIIGTEYSRRIPSGQRLTSKFNSFMGNCVYMFCDEVSLRAEDIGLFNALVTEKSLLVEKKGKEAKEVANCLHITMATNAEWVAPVKADTRRFFINEVDPRYSMFIGSEREKSADYFNALAAEMKNGGLEAMLYDLLRINLTGWNVYDVPQTEEIKKHRANMTDGSDEAVKDFIFSGDFKWRKEGAFFYARSEEIIEHLRERNPEARNISHKRFFMELKKIGLEQWVRREGNKTMRYIRVPSLQECRLTWCGEYNTTIEAAFPPEDCPSEWSVDDGEY
jgi:hypothetical protein